MICGASIDVPASLTSKIPGRLMTWFPRLRCRLDRRGLYNNITVTVRLRGISLKFSCKLVYSRHIRELSFAATQPRSAPDNKNNFLIVLTTITTLAPIRTRYHSFHHDHSHRNNARSRRESCSSLTRPPAHPWASQHFFYTRKS